MENFRVYPPWNLLSHRYRWPDFHYSISVRIPRRESKFESFTTFFWRPRFGAFAYIHHLPSSYSKRPETAVFTDLPSSQQRSSSLAVEQYVYLTLSIAAPITSTLYRVTPETAALSLARLIVLFISVYATTKIFLAIRYSKRPAYLSKVDDD